MWKCTTDVYFKNYFTFFSSSKEYVKPYFLSMLAKKEGRNLCIKIYGTRKTAGLGNEIKERM